MENLGKSGRRAADTVLISGMAVLALGLWSSVKFAVLTFLRRQELYELAGEMGFSVRIIDQILIMSIGVVLLLPIVIHGYIGFSARALALDKKLRPPFLILAGLLLVTTILSAGGSLLELLIEAEETQGVSLIIDLSLIYALFSLMQSAIKLKRIRKNQRG
ncbi:MAG: hypothetical protein J6P72_09205 [Firmicutes bacterium]|nr:hypothetical protein [Bacillota bacterium]